MILPIVFTFFMLLTAVLTNIYLNTDRMKNFKKGTLGQIELQKCVVCQKAVSPRFSECPHCGDLPYDTAIMQYGLAAFAFLFGLQVLQLPVLKNGEKRYLYTILLMSSFSFFIAAFFSNPLGVDRFFSHVIMLGFFLLLLASCHLSYIVCFKQDKARRDS